MTRIRPWLAIAAFTMLVGAICTTTMRASPTNCDNLCRARQYMSYHVKETYVYFKFEKGICHLCVTANGLCLPKLDEDPVDLECKTPAGQENANKRWAIEASTICDHDPLSTQYIQAKAAEPANQNDWTANPISECKPKPIPGEG